MKWIYGKHDFKSLERAQENCYLLTNGLGGFSSMTMAGSAARNDHAVFMACVQSPNQRYNMLHRLRETLWLEENGAWQEYVLSSQEFAGGERETGFQYINSFTYEDTPVWRLQVQGVEIRKEAGMAQGKNQMALSYEIRNTSDKSCRLTLVPFLQFVKKGSQPSKEQEFTLTENKIKSGGLTLYFRTNGIVTEIPEQEETYFYSYDACDGRQETGSARANHTISVVTGPKETQVLEVIYEMEPGTESAGEVITRLIQARRRLSRDSGMKTELSQTLSKSAAQFISERESVKGHTILAGFPFFEDWGRDTMIALPGICLATGQYETAREILRTFAVHERNGLMPNLFPEGGNEPMYNTVDAALLFINCVYLYYEASMDKGFVKEMYPVMKRIMEGYRKGTDYGIFLDRDWLLQAGEGLSQLTWMDVRVGDVLPTKRHGKPVEINAYWYNALCIMDAFEQMLPMEASGYGILAERMKTAFLEKFWMEEHKCLKDLVSGTKADRQIRVNQIWAVSMPFTMLDREKEHMVVQTVFEKLYTPYGLRTLAMEDEEFHPFYGGTMLERDMAYHQGTVWVFPLGAFYLAWLKVHDYSEEAKDRVRDWLEVMESALREGCIGQLPELYDGKNPARSKGCFAQAWSVGEILRVYKMVEE